MRKFTRIAATAAIFAIAAGLAQAQEGRIVRIAMDATYPPFEFA